MNPERVFQVLLAPVITEKTSKLASAESPTVSNHYAFKVATNASKDEITSAVEFLFKVSVENVRVINVKGKVKRSGRVVGKRQDWRKAYVRLVPGQMIDYNISA